MYKKMYLGVMKDEDTGERIKDNVEYLMRDSDKALILCVEGNPDYQQYLKDVAEGAEVTDFDYDAEDLRQETDSAEETLKAEQEAKVQAKMRSLAIKELKKDGELPEDYK